MCEQCVQLAEESRDEALAIVEQIRGIVNGTAPAPVEPPAVKFRLTSSRTTQASPPGATIFCEYSAEYHVTAVDIRAGVRGELVASIDVKTPPGVNAPRDEAERIATALYHDWWRKQTVKP